MRTTIELKNDQRARLLDLAARRGLKGFSALVGEALDMYLARVMARSPSRNTVNRFQGCLSKDQADHLRKVSADLRTSWR